MIHTEILATGDEIRSGALVDSNSAWLAGRLEESGLAVRRHLCVGDDLNDLILVLTEMSRRAEVVVVTGGLGPTPDDLSAQAAAQSLGTDLELRPEALADIEAFFRSLGRDMPESNRKQAMLPQGAIILPNPVGTAPGFWYEHNGCVFFFLPGVPAEMRRMFTDSVLPALLDRYQDRLAPSMTLTLSTFGLSESGAASSLEDFPAHFADINLGFRAHFPEIQIKLTASGPDEQEVRARLHTAAAWVREKAGTHIFSDSGHSMAQVVLELMRNRQATLAVAESCTGGLIGHWLTQVPGSSEIFTLSAVTYANAAKERILGVRPESLSSFGAVSEQVAEEMAAGVRRAGTADFGLATTGIAGPGGGTEDKPVGTVCIALAGPEQTISNRFQFRFRSRDWNKTVFAMTALDMLRRHLEAEQRKREVAPWATHW